MTTYDVTLYGLLFKKKLKNIKGHVPLSLDKGFSNILMFIYENEEREFVNMSKYKRVHFTHGWYKLEEERVKKDSNGVAQVVKS